MSKKEKLIRRLKLKPRDFTYKEVKSLLKLFGYIELSTGRTSGSRVSFERNKKIIRIHRPHPHNELLAYQVNYLIDKLEQEGLI